MHKAAIVGASGFTGAELLRIGASHSEIEVVVATGDSMAGRTVADLYPSLAAAYPCAEFVTYEPGVVAGCDLAFCALPHGASQSVVGELREDVAHIVDLAAENDGTLIVMCTHGRSGLGRWIMGSVADRVLRSSHSPVLLIRPQE